MRLYEYNRKKKALRKSRAKSKCAETAWEIACIAAMLILAGTAGTGDLAMAEPMPPWEQLAIGAISLLLMAASAKNAISAWKHTKRLDRMESMLETEKSKGI